MLLISTLIARVLGVKNVVWVGGEAWGENPCLVLLRFSNLKA